MGMIGNTLAQGLISGANIQDGTVDTPDLKDSAVTAAKIATGTITPNKLSTGAPTWDSAGNLGVGLSSLGYGTNARLTLYRPSMPELVFADDLTPSAVAAPRIAGGTAYMTFSTNGSERARIDSSGRVGIGTNSPAFRLDVSGAGDVVSVSASASGQVLRLSQSSANPLIVRMVNNSGNFWDTQANTDNSISWDYNDGERARITSAGAFGIGNSSPTYYLDVGPNSGNDGLIRARGSFLSRKYSFGNNGTTARTLRLSITNSGLQFSNFFMDASAHYYNNGGAWQATRFAFQFMAESNILRLNQRMPNYEYGGSTSGVFSVGNPPSWTYAGNDVWYFDFTVNGGFVSYISLIANGPGIQDMTLTVV